MRYVTIYRVPDLGWRLRYSDLLGEWNENRWPETWRINADSWYAEELMPWGDRASDLLRRVLVKEEHRHGGLA